MKRHKLLAFLLLFAVTGLFTALQPCDTWVAMKDATIDGSIILSKNSDRPPMEAQPLTHYPRMKHPAGSKVKCTYIEIPQVAETYEIILSKIWWTFGGEHGMNEYGVAIGNEAVWSHEPYRWNDGLLGMDMLRLGLERGKTAYEAMHVMIDLLQKYGQSGDAEYPDEWGKGNYHNSFIIADPNEAWVLETAGIYWAAKKITSGVWSISNIYSIEDDFDESHPDLIKHALEQGYTKNAEDFNFARDYGDYWTAKSPNAGDMQIRRNSTYDCMMREYAHITPQVMMSINRTHHEGTVIAPRWGAAETFWATPCMHDNAHSGYRTAASMVCHLRSWMPPLLRQVYWASSSVPCVNVFKPFYFQGVKVPDNYAKGTHTYSADSPHWWAERVKLLTSLNYQALAPVAKGVFAQTEEWEKQRQEQVEAKALKLINAGKKGEAVQVLQKFVDENCARVEREYKMLNKQLAEMLPTVGIKYVYLDYMKGWTAKAGVPLPIQ
jgi:secernin